jgi:hypothetical protein
VDDVKPRELLSPLATTARWLLILYTLWALAGLAFIGWLLAILLLDSWGVSVGFVLAALAVVFVSIGLAVARTVALIRASVVAAIIVLWFVAVQPLVGDTSSTAWIVAYVVLMLAAFFAPNLVVKRYERSRSRPSELH